MIQNQTSNRKETSPSPRPPFQTLTLTPSLFSKTKEDETDDAMDGPGELQCVGKLEIAKPKTIGFLCGTLPVLTDSTFPIFRSALVPSPHTTGVPRYQMLPAETDLNTLPLLPNSSEKVVPAAAKPSEEVHWENGSVSQSLSQKCEALAVSGLTEYGDEIDVVAPTDILKQIFKMPYVKAQLSIAVHRIGDTLILNTGPDLEEGEKIFRRQSNHSKGSDPSILSNFMMHSVRAEACDCPPTHHPTSEEQSSSTILPGYVGHREGSFVSSTNSHSTKSQFFDKNARGSSKAAQTNCDKYFWGTKQNKRKTKGPDSVKGTSEVREKARGPVQESEKYRRVSNNGFRRVLFWQFHNFRMLLGSDLHILSNEKYVAVSLHLWDVARQVTPVTWLEAWLDNVMASVPELAICYHENGVVRGYELLKTDDIFLLKGISEDGTPAFHPQVVQQNGLSVLRFLQENCKQDPGAYWLYKSAGEDVIQLFDLSVIPKDHENDDHIKSCRSLPSLMQKGRKESLFSLGTLLYRVAHRLSLSKAPDSRLKCAKFFKKCLDFLREQDHLVVRAYAHEQFARLILKCYEELELTSDSFLLESEVTVTDLEDESAEFSQGMCGPTGQDMVPSLVAEDKYSTNDGTSFQGAGPEASGLNLEAKSCSISSAPKTESIGNLVNQNSLVPCELTATAPHLVRTIADPISSKLAAIHHVSQAIKSLSWKRQLQKTQADLVDQGNRIQGRSINISLCSCGDVDCIEVCDIREWLPKSKMDQRMWNLVLLLGESYLALGEAYKADGQLHQALKVVRLACLVYGSMPQHLEDARFISSMVSSSSCQLKFKDDKEKKLEIDGAEGSDSNFLEEDHLTDQFSPTYLFWAKAWSLVGDVYVEYHRTRGKENLVQTERKIPGSEPRMANEVVKEVERLKKKLGQFNKNCNSCSLINCSCQSDRASSGSSASSSRADAPTSVRKHGRKSNTRNSHHSIMEHTSMASSEDDLHTNIGDLHIAQSTNSKVKELMTSNVADNEDIKATDETTSRDVAGSEPCTKDVPDLKSGGIFKLLEGPRLADAEYNLLAANDCYDAAEKAVVGFPTGSAEFRSVFKKKGWVCNELGRYRLENKNLVGAEVAFADAIKAFKEVSDHTNIILINCNLGHGRRALAEELVSKMELKKHDLLQNAYKQALKTAKLEYFESLSYYGAARAELAFAAEEVDSLLSNEVHTQFAHTYLRLGMLLAREWVSAEENESAFVNKLSSNGRSKEWIKHEISASDAFREALSMYESLGDLRKQEAAFAHFQLACYYKDTCLKFLTLNNKQVKASKSGNNRQKARWYASLAEKTWQKSMDFYGPRTHPVVYLNILLEQSALSCSLSNSLHSSTMLEAALLNLLEGRHVSEANEDCQYDQNTEIVVRFWNQLQVVLKNMLSASLLGSSNKTGAATKAETSDRTDLSKLKEMYRLSLKSPSLAQLHAMHRLWVS